jgi:hypothetical protein
VNEIALAERARIVGLLERALERYDEKQIREYVKGIVDGNRVEEGVAPVAE